VTTERGEVSSGPAAAHRPVDPVPSSRLARLVGTAPTRGEPAEKSVHGRSSPGETCDLCAAPIADTHRHLLELESSDLRCVCTPCSILFDRREASLGRFRLVPDRVLAIRDFQLDDQRWADLSIPVGLAYLVWSSRENRVRAFYPGALGAVESRLGLEAWNAIVGDNPVLATLEPDVEALLIRRLPRAVDHWLVSIADCFELVATLRTRWRGLTGGERVWEEIDQRFERFEARARMVDRQGRTIASGAMQR
jgi:hypothetical protein